MVSRSQVSFTRGQANDLMSSLNRDLPYPYASAVKFITEACLFFFSTTDGIVLATNYDRTPNVIDVAPWCKLRPVRPHTAMDEANDFALDHACTTAATTAAPAAHRRSVYLIVRCAPQTTGCFSSAARSSSRPAMVLSSRCRMSSTTPLAAAL